MIIISGPSTVGKNPFIYKACSKFGLDYIVPVTSRAIRLDERDKEDYYFITKDSFQSKVSRGEILNWDYALGNYYGYYEDFSICKSGITHGLSRMAIRIKKQYPQHVTTVFLRPTNLQKIINTLESIYSSPNLQLRIDLVHEEICHSVMFDYIFDVDKMSTDLLENEEICRLLQKERENKNMNV